MTTATMFPRFYSDVRLRSALRAAVENAFSIVSARDLLAGIVRCGDAGVGDIVIKSLAPAHTLMDLLLALQGGGTRTVAWGGQSEIPFGPNAVRALEMYQKWHDDAGDVVTAVALEGLSRCVLLQLEDPEKLPLLDIGQALQLLTQRIGQVLGAREANAAKLNGVSAGHEDSCPLNGVELPAGIGPVEDVTLWVETAAAVDVFPFDGDPAYEAIFDKMARTLHRRQSGHVLLVGEPGVGKSTLFVELARRASSGCIPFLRDRHFISLDCRFVPAEDSKHRLGELFPLAQRPELVVAIDGFASLLRGERGGTNKAMLFSLLGRCGCRFVALLSVRDYEELISDDPDFADFFGRVDVEEPSCDLAIKILRHFALGLERKYAVTIDPEAIRQAVLLADNYILNDRLPAKALKVLQRICEDIDYETSQLGKPRPVVTAEDVVRVVSEISGVPIETLWGVADKFDYEQSLRDLIFGQDHAVREVANELSLIKAGMTDPQKPASVMLFIGQTGTGKTEIAKMLARFYSVSKRLKTYTLGNCVEPHSVSTIIGVPPGYVGNDQGGRLINELNADPYCVFLLDEADKAHPDVLQPFLNLFDEGWVCDQRGSKAYANKSIFILTANVGQRMIADMVQQGKSQAEITERMKEALSQIKHSKSERPVFTAEFLARIKRFIVFKPLDRLAMQGISRRLLAEMQRDWAIRRGKKLEIPDSLVDLVAARAHELNDKSKGREGGRIVRKLISEWIELPMQRQISERMDDYKTSARVILDHVSPAETAAQTEDATWPRLGVRFCP